MNKTEASLITNKIKVFINQFLIGTAIFSLIALIKFYYWGDGVEDLHLFWSAACKMDLPKKALGCLNLTTKELSVGQQILNIYPSWSYFLFQIIGQYEFQVVANSTLIFIIVSLGLVYSSIRMQFSLNAQGSLQIILSIIILALFAPIRDLFRTGQFAWIQLLSFTGFLICFTKGKTPRDKLLAQFLSGFLLSFSMIKPQALYLLYLTILSNVFRGKMIAISVGMLFGFACLCLFSNTMPFWRIHFDQLDQFVYWSQPVLADLILKKKVSIRIISLIVFSLLAIFQLTKLVNNPITIILILIPLSQITMPYGFSYDLVLLLPGFIYLLNDKRMHVGLLIGTLVVAAINYYFYHNQLTCIGYTIIILLLGSFYYLKVFRLENPKSLEVWV